MSRKRKKPDLKIEKECFRNGIRFVGGIDEVGIASLAGPVVAGCVVMENKKPLSKWLKFGINDSKKLTAKERNRLINVIKKHCTSFGVGIINNNEIDKINILRASHRAMRMAVKSLEIKPDFLLIDGKYRLPGLKVKQKAIIDGDEKSISVAAASIIAKVTRDRIMLRMHKLFPNYGFRSNKGYPTRFHMLALKKFGPCKIHRKSFLKKINF